ncbi:MAG: hypothetical protein RBQ81_09090 [Arcobacteraceae bacterium]|nr:hypothetical protein [Arcobacteraceae bacterium]
MNSLNKEQINYVTLGEGVVHTNSNIVDLNRNINNSQLITKDENSSMEIYLSNTSINKALKPNDTLDKWTQDAKDLGLNVRDEILTNLPSAKKEDANTIDNTIGKALDIAGDYSLGLIPSIDNQGGYITQIATQLFGDNRGIIETATMQELLDMGVDQKDIVQIEDGKYITNPYKTVIVLKDEEAIKKEQSLSEFNHAKIYLTQEQASSITHISTNGILSDLHSTRTGTKEQTADASVVFINYNPSHGLVGDMIESTQDKLASHLVPYNSYASYLGTGGSKQSANSLLNLAEAKDGELVLVAHSQGTLQSFIAMHYIKPNLQNILKDKEDTTFKVGFYGSPVNGKDSIDLVRDLYINSPVYTNTDIKVSDYFRSSVNPGDPVAILGGNTAGINSKEGFWTNLLYSIKRGVPTLLNGGLEANKNNLDKTSPHAGGACVIGCGDERITPDIKYYINIDGEQIKLEDFYIERNLNSELAKYPQSEIE